MIDNLDLVERISARVRDRFDESFLVTPVDLKCALHGNDPNWGRVLAAVGTTTAVFRPEDLGVAMNDVWVCRSGTAAEDRSKVDLTGEDVRITVDLGAGAQAATVWTNDLTAAYVHENSAYST